MFQSTALDDECDTGRGRRTHLPLFFGQERTPDRSVAIAVRPNRRPRVGDCGQSGQPRAFQIRRRGGGRERGAGRVEKEVRRGRVCGRARGVSPLSRKRKERVRTVPAESCRSVCMQCRQQVMAWNRLAHAACRGLTERLFGRPVLERERTVVDGGRGSWRREAGRAGLAATGTRERGRGHGGGDADTGVVV